MNKTNRFYKFTSCLTMRLAIVVGMLTCMCQPCVSFAQSTKKEIPAISSVDADDSDKMEVMVKGEYIYVTTSRNITFRLYSILGQLINQQSIQPGTTRIKAPARGVYILKAGPITRRVTVN